MLALVPTLLQKKDGRRRIEIDVRNTGGWPWSLTQRDLQRSLAHPTKLIPIPLVTCISYQISSHVDRKGLGRKHRSTTVVGTITVNRVTVEEAHL